MLAAPADKPAASNQVEVYFSVTKSGPVEEGWGRGGALLQRVVPGPPAEAAKHKLAFTPHSRPPEGLHSEGCKTRHPLVLHGVHV